MSLRYMGNVKLCGKMNLSGNKGGYSSVCEEAAGSNQLGSTGSRICDGD